MKARRHERLMKVVVATISVAGCASSDGQDSTPPASTSATTEVRVGSPARASSTTGGIASTAEASTTSADLLPTVSELYRSVDQALTSEAPRVLHIRSETSVDLEPGLRRTDLYIDPTIPAARTDSAESQDGIAGTRVWLTTESTTIELAGGNRRLTSPQLCPDASAAASWALQCEVALPGSTVKVERAEDRRHVLLVTTATVPQTTQADPLCNEATCPTVSFNLDYVLTLTVDRDTAMPISRDEVGTYDLGTGGEYQVHTDYTHEYVGRSTLPSDFFDPPEVP